MNLFVVSAVQEAVECPQQKLEMPNLQGVFSWLSSTWPPNLAKIGYGTPELWPTKQILPVKCSSCNFGSWICSHRAELELCGWLLELIIKLWAIPTSVSRAPRGSPTVLPRNWLNWRQCVWLINSSNKPPELPQNGGLGSICEWHELVQYEPGIGPIWVKFGFLLQFVPIPSCDYGWQCKHSCSTFITYIYCLLCRVWKWAVSLWEWPMYSGRLEMWWSKGLFRWQRRSWLS